MSKSVFISHAVKDKLLAAAIVELLEGGIGVPEDEIFCSSLSGYGIPTGKNFVTFIKGQIQEPDCVILLITPNYFASNFCLSELGAAWAMSHTIFPILVEPVGYSDVKDVLLGTQVAKIDDEIKYNEIRDYLREKIKCEKKSNIKWDTTRKTFLEKLPKIMKKIKAPPIVSAQEHEKIKLKLTECEEELLNYQRELNEKNEFISNLKKLKDAEDVKALEKTINSDDEDAALNDITMEIKKYKAILTKEVLKFVICKHYGQPYKIDWGNYREQFSDATRSKYIETEEVEQVNWNNHKMSKLKKLLKSLDDLECSEDFPNWHIDTYDVPFEPDNQEFWRLHYEI